MGPLNKRLAGAVQGGFEPDCLAALLDEAEDMDGVQALMASCDQEELREAGLEGD